MRLGIIRSSWRRPAYVAPSQNHVPSSRPCPLTSPPQPPIHKSIIQEAGKEQDITVLIISRVLDGRASTPGMERKRLANALDDNRRNTLVGTVAADVISGLGGNDTSSVLLATTGILGGLGNDRLDGGNGNDRLLGNEGKTVIGGRWKGYPRWRLRQ